MEQKRSSGGLFKLLLITIVITTVILISVQNNKDVEVGLVFFKTQVPLTVLLIGNFLFGFCVGLVFWIMSAVKNRKILKLKEIEIASLEERLRKLHEKIDDLSGSETY